MDHRRTDEISLCYHQVVRERIARQPALIAQARSSLARWLETCSPDTRSVLLEWSIILDSGPAEIDRVLRSDDENVRRLRQSSPFAGETFITRHERNELLRQHRP